MAVLHAVRQGKDHAESSLTWFQTVQKHKRRYREHIQQLFQEELCRKDRRAVRELEFISFCNQPPTFIPLCYKDKTIPILTTYEQHIKVTNSNILDCSDVLIDPFQAPGNRSLIPIEKAEAQLLFIAGQDDPVVKRKYYATEVCKLLQAQGKENFQILSHPGTGHCIDPTFFPLYPIGNHPIFHKRAVLGEEFGAYSKAQVHAWPQIQAFFQKYLNDK